MFCQRRNAVPCMCARGRPLFNNASLPFYFLGSSVVLFSATSLNRRRCRISLSDFATSPFVPLSSHRFAPLRTSSCPRASSSPSFPVPASLTIASSRPYRNFPKTLPSFSPTWAGAPPVLIQRRGRDPRTPKPKTVTVSTICHVLQPQCGSGGLLDEGKWVLLLRRYLVPLDDGKRDFHTRQSYGRSGQWGLLCSFLVGISHVFRPWLNTAAPDRGPPSPMLAMFTCVPP
ncbi:hypothetical protein EDB80DRAFT_719156 [Ilyonectria destructans]|nr:hypothetical protein EDB80DRAFT_719156 [Ilyonectria destructans]